jgi:hypothetical protein
MCDGTGNWPAGGTACSGSTPYCDPTSHTCTKSPNGGGCPGGNGQCVSGVCLGGTCCQTACNGPCDTGFACDSTGACVHKQVGTFCNSIPGSNPGNNDFQLFCNNLGSCVGPTFMCGKSTHTCASDGTTACCVRPIVMGGTTTYTNDDCGPASTCAGNYGENCLLNSDCPLDSQGNHTYCCFTGGFGFGWSVCQSSTCPDGRQMCATNTDCVGVTNGGASTTCQNYNGTEHTCL